MITRKMQDYVVKGKKVFIGLEDSKRSWKLCVRCEGMEIHQTSMPAQYPVLRSYLTNRYPRCEIVVMYEAGFAGFGLHDRLVGDGFGCVVIPPHLVTEAKVSKVKTDRKDARRLAKILENGDYSACFVPDRERREDRQLSRTLRGVQEDMVAIKNRIRKFLDFHGIPLKLSPGLAAKADIIALRDLALSGPLKTSFSLMVHLLEELKKADKTLRGELKKLTTKERYAKAFQMMCSAPGIGWFTAIRLVLEWGEDLSRFSRGDKLASFVGLTGKENSTGEQVHRGGLTKLGHGFVRGWLIECAWTSIQKDPVLMEKFRRVAHGCNNRKRAIVAVARMLVVRLHYCVTHNQPYQLGIIQ